MRRIEKAAHIRRETVGAYLRAAGIAVRPAGGWERSAPKPAIEVSTDSAAENRPLQPGRSPSASACEPHREVIEADLAKGRNAMAIWQDLVDGHWEERWADTRIHGTTERQVAAMYAEEKPALLPLPVEPFRYYNYGERTVHLDGCVEVEAAYYGAPPGWIGRRVHVQLNAAHVRLIDPLSGQLLREHLRQQRGRHRIQEQDRPNRTPLSAAQLLRRAEIAGPHIGALCQALHRNLAKRRRAGSWACSNLTKKYGVASTDQACASPWKPARANITSCAATWNITRNCR